MTGTIGNVIHLGSAPSSVALHQTESATSAIAFNERQRVELTAPLRVNYVVPGPETAGFPNQTLPAGTIVDSHLVHSDPVKLTGVSRRVGSVTFAGEIIGVITGTRLLSFSDFLGAPGTTYGGTKAPRGFEGRINVTGSPVADRYTISPDLRTINLDFKTYLYDEIRILTKSVTTLETTIVDSPDPVTLGNDVQYTLTVKNVTGSPIDAHVVNTLPVGATLKFAPLNCMGTLVVDCALGSIAGGAEASVNVVVTTPPSGTSMTTTATATPGPNPTAIETTTIEPVVVGDSKGWVMPGQSLSTYAHDPATVSLPNTSTGAPVLINQSMAPASFCGGPCAGPVTSVEPFPGYSNPAAPVSLRVVWNFLPGDPQSVPDPLTAAAIAFNKPLYVQDSGNPLVGALVPPCAAPGIANPNPCYNSHTITEPVHGSFAVTFVVLYTGQAITVGRS